ncbi:PAC2 family protein [Granulicoccus sp. GXG6511]|uniref:PAC2 family protein n=1 Tax=Granulicoccus sp. GXG6511 TaxID=3381351 RepID=UPI003D7D89D8
MLDPVSLFEFDPHVDRRTVRARTLLVTLGSRDPGHTQRTITQHLLNTLPNHRLGGVDSDQVLDYGALRPGIGFERDHFTGYRTPTIDLHHVSDAQGKSFLLLAGPEPSLQWERLVGTVDYLIDQFDITETVILQGVPAPAPHTRPLHVSRFAGGPDLVPVEDSVPMAFEMGATFTSLLSLRLGERGRTVTGLVAHVPHYLAQGDVPEAAIALLDRLSGRTRLELPLGGLPAAAQILRERVDAEVTESEEAQQMVAQLEEQFDHFMTQRSLTQGAAAVPSADEIGAQVEDFLRGLDDEDGSAGDDGAVGDSDDTE